VPQAARRRRSATADHAGGRWNFLDDDQLGTRLVELAQCGVELARVARRVGRQAGERHAAPPFRPHPAVAEDGAAPASRRRASEHFGQMFGRWHQPHRRRRRVVCRQRSGHARHGVGARVLRLAADRGQPADDRGDLLRGDPLPDAADARASPAPRLRSRIVDSMPTAQRPPSRISRCTARRVRSRTCAASVGLMRPKRLADGAAMPHRPPSPPPASA
jgi:hypothetical protein